MTLPVDPLVVDVCDDRLQRAALAEGLREGLTRPDKRISPAWHYDERGRRLFQEIVRSEEYYVARAEEALLRAHVRDIARLSAPAVLVELPSGTASNAGLLLDVVPEAAAVSTHRELHVAAARGDVERHLERQLGRLPSCGPRLIALLGNTIGNLRLGARHSLLAAIRSAMTRSDRLLLGVDLVKDVDRLVAAYDDAHGHTAAFNRNALCAINRQSAGDFDPWLFDHFASWNARSWWVEMRLRAREQHAVHLHALDLRVELERGETVLTGISTAFTLGRLWTELDAAGLEPVAAWDHDVALVLAAPR